MEHQDALTRREKPSNPFTMALLMLCDHQNVLKINLRLTALSHLLLPGHLILASHSGDLFPMIMRVSTGHRGDLRLRAHLEEELIKAAKEEERAINALSLKGIDIKE